MITEQQIDEQGERIMALAKQIETLKEAYAQESAKLILMIADKFRADMKTAKLAACVVNTQAPLHYEAPKLVVLPTAPETAPIPKAVQVNWSRGFSGANYPVLGHGVSNGKRYYAINNSTDDSKPMIKRVWANDCQVGIEKVAIAQEKAAA